MTEVDQPVVKELEPKTPVTFVYRGENPLLKSLAAGLEQKGYPVVQRAITPEVYQETENKLNRGVDEAQEGGIDLNK